MTPTSQPVVLLPSRQFSDSDNLGNPAPDR